MKPRSKIVALHRANFSLHRNGDGLQRSIATCLDNPCARSIGSVARCYTIDCAVTELAGETKKLHAKTHYSRGSCLLEDAEDVRSLFCQGCRDGQQQRAAACKYHSLAFDGQSGHHHRLKTANSHHALQRPSRKWQKTFTCSRRQDESPIPDVLKSGGSFNAQNVG